VGQTDGKFEFKDGVSLRDYFDSQINDLRRSIVVAQVAMERRLEGMNEFRESLRDQNTTLARKEELEGIRRQSQNDLESIRGRLNNCVTASEHQLICDRLDKLEVRINSLEQFKAEMGGKASQSSVSQALLISGIGILIGIVSIVLGFIGK
jgi:hypothetical protein